MRDELLKGLTEEQKKKVVQCNSTEEVLEYVKSEGIELTDEQLEAVNGGLCFQQEVVACPRCGASEEFLKQINYEKEYFDKSAYYYECTECGYRIMKLVGE